MNKYTNILLDITDREDLSDQGLYYFGEDEVGLTHWGNNSVVAIRDNGCIDAFVEETTGIRLDPIARSANVFSPKVNIYSNRTHIRTDPHGLIWNGMSINPDIYEWCKKAPLSNYNSLRGFKLVCEYQYLDKGTWKTTTTSIAPFLKDTYIENYSPEVLAIINKLGIKLGG